MRNSSRQGAFLRHVNVLVTMRLGAYFLELTMTSQITNGITDYARLLL